MPGSRARPAAASRASACAGHRVVVGERHHVEARRGGTAHHLGGRIRPVRRAAVHVQVGSHQGRRQCSRQARRGGPEGQVQVLAGIAQVAQCDRLDEQGARGVRPEHEPQPQPLGLAGEHGPVRRVHRPEREVVLTERGGGARRGGGEARARVRRGPGRPGPRRSRRPVPRPRPPCRPGRRAGSGRSGPPRSSAPVRSSPALAKPVTSQPAGSGQGSQTGTPAVPGRNMYSRPSRPSRDGLNGGNSVDLAVQVTSPGTGPHGRLMEGPAAAGTGRGRAPVTVLTHGCSHRDEA